MAEVHKTKKTLWHQTKGDVDYKTHEEWGTGEHSQESGRTINLVTSEEGQVT